MGKKRKQPTFEPVDPIINVMAKESERGSVLAGHAYLDYTLALALRDHFEANLTKDDEIDESDAATIDRMLFGQPDEVEAIAGSYAIRVSLARVCGLIDLETCKALRKLNRIRIKCAHHPGESSIDDTTAQEVFDAMNENCKQLAIVLRHDAKVEEWMRSACNLPQRPKLMPAHLTLMCAITALYVAIRATPAPVGGIMIKSGERIEGANRSD